MALQLQQMQPTLHNGKHLLFVTNLAEEKASDECRQRERYLADCRADAYDSADTIQVLLLPHTDKTISYQQAT